MVSVTKKYQVTIPLEVRKDLKIRQGDQVVFVKDKENKWVLMTMDELKNRMISGSKDIEKTVDESRRGFQKGTQKNIESLSNSD